MKWGEIHNYCISQTSRNTPHKVDSVDIAQQHNPQPYTKYVIKKYVSAKNQPKPICPSLQVATESAAEEKKKKKSARA